MGATRARIRRLESRIGATGDPYQGFTFGDYVKAADAGMKVSEAPLGLQRMHRSMQLTALACELRRTGIEEGIEVGDLETAIVEVGRSFGLPRDLIDKEIAHNRARYTEEVAISCAQVEARARGPADPHRPMGMRIGGPMDGVLAELISHVKQRPDKRLECRGFLKMLQAVS